MIFAGEFYKKNIEDASSRISELENKAKTIGWSRLVVILAWLIIGYYLYKENKINLIIPISIVFIVIFGIAIYGYNDILENKKRYQLLLNVNEKGEQRLSGNFKSFEDNGKEYLDEKHSFVNDLDVFGNSSIFQYINTTVTKGGREFLAKLLKMEIKLDKAEIKDRQKAINELSEKAKWRQKIIVEGSLRERKDIDLNAVYNWSQKKEDQFGLLRMVISCTFILVTIFFIYLSIIGLIRSSLILLDLMVNYVVVKILSKSMAKDLELFQSIKDTVYGYSKLLELMEDEVFESNYLSQLNSKLKNEKCSCKEEMKKLSKILDWMGNSSSNGYYIILNTLFFSDVFLIKRLEKWRLKNGDKINNWFDVMNQLDALCSISNIAFDNNNWIYPEILDNNQIDGIEIGHPLIGKNAIRNTFSLKGENKVALITGSNMSGKSTFLRTIGINLILSYIGAPVYAEKFSCGVMNIYTCMRTKDNLEENISSFYAEILRIKLLIEACKKGERVFFLLDEIFKGTNSNDRHVGATVLIKQLIENGGTGLVSTHDLELCDLENESKSIVNYNFREFYENNKIKFDYTLRKGRSKTQNAIHLMKLAGIEI